MHIQLIVVSLRRDTYLSIAKVTNAYSKRRIHGKDKIQVVLRQTARQESRASQKPLSPEDFI
ncbi:hypothetical protein PORCRE_209 [Porphyromonas crevioricanis JCM 15906]|uniref:Uncharacterized protein n=1 Tax=Porphyromonas crevioricanis JCM 15906 TaxID=1305617 RepID=S4N6Q3_9PORP|nr:hypothetical protein PORCRE_209 [Porphyromonas crevioricanis JCM 15906]GAD07918.1 hypothetical protein PORCAN_1547 [Porphyromonas crevioricanis JCM 13913]